ncbi:peptide/nickel transport system substrate-binding protein [Monaibacterium marinum]|uniref:Peptide/nickel transport system substrate-binding protein n=1 Tax=Pontivivens marinum TaxID=1690039 RepID=A0A2C9CUU9_9RHOB|nr:ABC transporter substrate-binding protein [Monaibacterium marinum]SOH95136.1 peptide/nickel transport system substrate-binding protein [Monaibacterium marinum]
MKKLLSSTALMAACAFAAPALADTAITVNATQVFGTIDPAKINDYTEYMAAVNLYDGLTTVDNAGSVVGQLAESWEVSEDNLTYTFHLTPGATFTDGSPVEASDVVYSIKRLLALNEGPSYLFSDLVDPEAVIAVDASTVSIGLTEVFAPFLATTPLILVLNEGAVAEASETEWGEDVIAEQTYGAGPYSVASWNRGAEFILSRNTNYYAGFEGGDGAPIDTVRFVITNDEATVRALATSGQLGFSASTHTNETYAALDGLDNYSVAVIPTVTNLYLKLNTQLAPTDDIHVRRALQYATDYTLIREEIFPNGELNGPMAHAFADALNTDLPMPEYNLEKAAEELAMSSYAGQDITISLAYVAGLSFEEDIALLLQANLEAIGVTLDIQPEPWNRITELAADPATTPNATEIFNGPSYPSPDSVFYVQYHSKSAGTWASMEWLETPAVDALIDESRATTDVAEQNAIYQELQATLVDMAADVFIGTQQKRHAIHSCLTGYEFIPMMSWDYNFGDMRWACE